MCIRDRARWVDEQADLGVAFDGDGDRVAFTDEKGQIIPGDFVTALIAREMLKKRPGAEILYDLRSSWVVPEEIKKAGGKAIECRVGHVLIKKQMREEVGYFAGELSSHYYVSDFYTTDNGDLAMLNIIMLLLAEGKKMSGSTPNCGMTASGPAYPLRRHTSAAVALPAMAYSMWRRLYCSIQLKGGG